MKCDRSARIRILTNLLVLNIVIALLITASPTVAAQPQEKHPAAFRLEVASGTSVSYRVREQLAGLKFPDDAVGTTDSVSGTLVLMPDGSIDSANSKVTIDLRTLKSDQDLRDNYIKTRTFDTDKFPYAEIRSKKIRRGTCTAANSGASRSGRIPTDR